jgi:hypothetical protein
MRSFHPRQEGHAATGAYIAKIIRDQVRFDDAPAGAPEPSPPSPSLPDDAGAPAPPPIGPEREIDDDYPFAVRGFYAGFYPQLNGESAERGYSYLLVGLRIRSLLTDRDIPAPNTAPWRLQTPDCAPNCGFSFFDQATDYAPPETPIDEYPAPEPFQSGVLIPPGPGYNVFLKVKVRENVDRSRLQIQILTSHSLIGRPSTLPRLPIANLLGVKSKIIEAVPSGLIGKWRGSIRQNGQTYPVTMKIGGGKVGEEIGTVSYPSYHCGGSLTLVDGSPAMIRVEETHERSDGCLDGLVGLRLNDNGTLKYDWLGGSNVKATGVLSRSQ